MAGFMGPILTDVAAPRRLQPGVEAALLHAEREAIALIVGAQAEAPTQSQSVVRVECATQSIPVRNIETVSNRRRVARQDGEVEGSSKERVPAHVENVVLRRG